MNSLLPLQLSVSGVLMIAAALGAVAGLFFFFHGFSLLQERRLSDLQARINSPQATNGAGSASNPKKYADAPKREPRTEVIQLTPSENQPNDTSAMSQQAKIAAALMKAGIPNPVTWAHEEVRVIDPPSAAEPSALAKEAEVSRVLQQGASAEAVKLPSRKTRSMDWKTRLMIWGGPMLTLACIYALVAHFGWL